MPPLTTSQFRSVFHRALRAMGLDPSEYGLHSFGTGAATAAAQLLLPDDIIQHIGHWRSGAYKYYVCKE